MQAQPYTAALAIIKRHYTSGGSVALAKFVLSLYNDENCFAFRECIAPLDSNNIVLCLEMARYFAIHGEDEELREVGREICKLYPRLLDIGMAGHDTKMKVRNGE